MRPHDEVETASLPGETERPRPAPHRAPPVRGMIACLAGIGVLFALLVRTDMPVMAWLERHGAPFDATPISLLRRLAEAQFLIVLGAVLLVTDRRGLSVVARMTLAIALGFVPMAIGKTLIDRQRPWVFVDHFAASAWNACWRGLMCKFTSDASMPSGHTYTAFAVALVLGRYYPRWRWAMLLLAVGTGCSRVLQQQHWPSDCLAGACVGGLAGRLALAARPPLALKHGTGGIEASGQAGD